MGQLPNSRANHRAAFHALPTEDALHALQTTRAGLTYEEAHKRLAFYGINAIRVQPDKPWWMILFHQLKSYLILILMAAAVISWVVGKSADAWIILIVIFINAFIGMYQELKANKSVKALKRMIVQKAHVRRGGEEMALPATELVPGDIVLMEEGDVVPADIRLLQTWNLRAVESSLTGESIPVPKDGDTLKPDTVLADRKNMAFKGTHIVAGRGEGLVVFTGDHTELGRIALKVTEMTGKKTHFQLKTDQLARHMGIVAVASALVLFLIGYCISGMPLEEILLVSIAALVSSVPEGLPAVLAIVMAVGSFRMAKRNAIVREPTSVETLGAVTTIITDKTGTLTQSSLNVTKIGLPSGRILTVSGEGWRPFGQMMEADRVIEPDSDAALRLLLSVAGYCNNAVVRHDQENDQYSLIGDPTEGALFVLARKAGIDPAIDQSFKRLDDLPFNSKRKMRATLVKDKKGEKQLLVIGAPDKVLSMCSHQWHENGPIPLTQQDFETMENLMHDWSTQAMRVIGLAIRPMPDESTQTEEEQIDDLYLLGLVGMIDPPRPEAREAVLKCHKAGIRIIMATGDHLQTALAIAKAVGITDTSKSVQAITESQLMTLDEKEFEQAVLHLKVFARLTPDMKLRIARTLQAKGELIAMTGDGVNDAPALKAADVGVSMGLMGTDVAREASRLVLADDNFATIVSAVEEGRIVFNNARQASFFLLITNFSEILILVSLVAFGFPVALTATQILWLNLVTDGLGDKALAMEGRHGDELENPPQRRDAGILSADVWPFLIMQAITMTTLALLVYFQYYPEDLDKARTAVFTTVAFSQLFNLFNLRSLRKSVFRIGVWSNKYVLIAFLISVFIQVIIIEIPFFESLFHFRPLTLLEFVQFAVMASSVLWIGEMYKWIKRKAILLKEVAMTE